MKTTIRRTACALVLACMAWTQSATAVQPDAGDPSLKAWFKADAITGLSDGNAVSSWVNSSSYANHATQASLSLQPIYRAGDASSGFDPFLEFTSDELVTGSGLGISGDITTTTFIVYRTTSPTAAQGVFGWGGAFAGTGTAFGLFPNVLAAGVQVHYANSQGSYWSVFPYTSFQVMEVDKTPGPISNTSLYRDGAFVTPFASSPLTPNVLNTPLVIGAWADYPSQRLDGAIAELLVYDRTLTVTERQDVTQYLFNKYSIPEPSAAMLGSVALLLLRRHRS